MFLGGTGAGTLLVLCVLEWLRSCRGRDFGAKALPDELFVRAWCACLLCLGLGAAFILFDLGRIDALIYLLLTPQPVALTLGAFALPVSIAVALAFLCAHVLDGVALAWWGRRALAGIGVVLGAVVMSYTGFLLEGMPSVLAWQTPLVPALFALSSLSCGMAVIMASTAFVEVRTPLTGFAVRMLRTDSGLIVVEMVALAVFVGAGLAASQTSSSILAWLTGPLAPWFWVGLIGIGLVVPFVLERMAELSCQRPQLLFVAAAVLVGGLMMRCCLVGLADVDPARLSLLSQYNQNMPLAG